MYLQNSRCFGVFCVVLCDQVLSQVTVVTKSNKKVFFSYQYLDLPVSGVELFSNEWVHASPGGSISD